MKTTKSKQESPTASQIRMAQDLACELGHLNQGIKSLWKLYKSAPDLLTALSIAYDDIKHGEDEALIAYIGKVIAAAEGQSKKQRFVGAEMPPKREDN